MRTEHIATMVEPFRRFHYDDSITIKEFKCPCGVGKIIEEHDDIVGFKDHTVWITCPQCDAKYQLDTSNGVCNWELVPKQA